MVTLRFALFFIGTLSTVAASAQAQTDKAPKGVSEEYVGEWVCQTSMTGYNLTPPHADPSQPATSKLSTPPTVRVLKFSLRTDGTYEGAAATGRYAFNEATNEVAWLDGPHQKSFSKTELGRRDNGAPKIGLIMNGRYYGCFLAKPRR